MYLTGGGLGWGASADPKLCYSNVNLSSDPGSGGGGVGDVNGDRRRWSGGGALSVNVATPFHSSLLFSSSSSSSQAAAGGPSGGSGGGKAGRGAVYSLCVSDESTLRLGVIDDIQKLHVTTRRLGMAPRRVAHHAAGRVVAVGCIDDTAGGVVGGSGESNMGNCVRFFDDASFEELDR